MGVSPPQLSGVRALNCVLAASRLAQSMTRPRLASGSATTMPFSQVGGAAWVGPAARPANSSVANKKEKAHLRMDHLGPDASPLPRQPTPNPTPRRARTLLMSARPHGDHFPHRHEMR